MMVEVYDIQWITDGASPEECGLPKSVTMQISEELFEDPCMTDVLGDMLSNEYGFLHDGFLVDKIKEENK